MQFKRTPPSYFEDLTTKRRECLNVPSSKFHDRFKSNQIHKEVLM